MPKEISAGAFCPAVVDMDNDGDLDLVLADVARSTKTHFLYFQQQGNGRFKLQKKNPFADISIKGDVGSFQFQLADFDGDGLVDMVASGSTSLQYFRQRTCVPTASACSSSATCNKKTSTCECPTGSHSPSAAFAAGIIHVKMGCARVALASSVCQARIQDIFCHLSHYHLKSWHLQPVPHEFFKHLQTQGVNSTTVNSKNAPQR